jgi:glycosyltransferase involved in cell wall biosynthesis
VTGPNAAVPRVLVVTKRLAVGGTEYHLVQILPELRARGMTVMLFVLERGGELEPILEAAGVLVEGVSRHGPRWIHLVRAGLALARCIRRWRPDMVHFFLPEAYLVGSMIAMLVGHRRCVMSRRSLADYQRGRPWFARLERLLHRRTLAVLGNSHAVVDELAIETGDRSKVGLIHNGVAIPQSLGDDIRSQARGRLGIADDAFVMVIVANLFPYKGHADLIVALIEIAPRLPQPWRLIVVGRDEGIGPALRAQATDGGIAEHICWLGARDDVGAILPAADLALLVSHQEGFSNALLEAMAQGLAVIATDVGGNRDAIRNGESGRLVPVRDPIRLGEAILELAYDKALRRRFGTAARHRAINLFSTENAIRHYQQLYQGFAELGRRPVQAIVDGNASIQH